MEVRLLGGIAYWERDCLVAVRFPGNRRIARCKCDCSKVAVLLTGRQIPWCLYGTLITGGFLGGSAIAWR